MMTEISLNILDVAENSTRAGASLVSITVSADTKADRLTVVIEDDGCGMTEEQLARVTDPFFTTRTTRKVGLGVPFFKEAAELTGGSFAIQSEPGKGTSVTAVFVLSSIDRMPLGDISATIHNLVVYHPGRISATPTNMTGSLSPWIRDSSGKFWETSPSTPRRCRPTSWTI